jgi:hypothetical protein
MNERIRQLADEAEEWNADGDKCEVNLHKFAELIVKECMNVLDPGEHQLIARFHTRQWLSEHFGVK